MSSDTSSLLVIVPAYNEEGAVSGVIRSVREVLPGVRIIVIDDGSWDNTARVAERGGADVFRLPHHLGLGGAVQTGYRFAFPCIGPARTADGTSMVSPGARR